MDEDASGAGREVQAAMLPNVPSDFAFYIAVEAVKKHKHKNGDKQQYLELTTF